MRRQLPRTRDQERKPRGCCPADCRALENLPTSPLPRGRLRAYWARMTRIMAPRRALLTTSATFTEGRTHVDSSINYRRGRLHRLCPRASLAPRGPSGRQRGHCYSRRKAGESRANANLTTLPIHLRAIAMSPLGANHPRPDTPKIASVRKAEPRPAISRNAALIRERDPAQAAAGSRAPRRPRRC